MNSYNPDTPRTVFGIAAAAISTLTLAVLVVAPATMDARGVDARGDAATILARVNGHMVAPIVVAPIEAAIVPGHIEVVGTRPAHPARALVSRSGQVPAGIATGPAVIEPSRIGAPNVACASSASTRQDCKPAS